MSAKAFDSTASSPDLLGRSVNNHTSSPANRRPHISAFTPNGRITRRSSPLKTNVINNDSNNIQLQDYYLTTPQAALATRNSPTRSVTRQTENVISPWRIRVRVEAEREEPPHMAENRTRTKRISASPSKAKSPSKSLLERTTTVTVPLKGGDDTPQAKRARGRPRKSATPAKRPGTPKPSTSKPPSDAAEPKDASALPLQSPKRGRPRKAMPQPGSEIQQGGLGSQFLLPDQSAARTSVGKKGSRARRKTLFHVAEIAMDSDAGTDEQGNDAEDLNQNTTTIQSNDPTENLEKQPLRQLSSISPQKGKAKGLRAEKSSKSHDPTTEHDEFDSILEAEDMTMITLNSVPSAQRFLESAQQVTGSDPNNGQNDSRSQVHEKPTVPPQHFSMFGEDLTTSNQTQGATPSQTFSSPRLPPPLQMGLTSSPRALNKPYQGSPKLNRVVRAGIALQGVTSSPRAEESVSANNPPSRNRFDDVFGGFGVSTRRELRAGLRLGEELAKRQRLADSKMLETSQTRNPNTRTGSEDDVFQELAKNAEASSSSLDPHSDHLRAAEVGSADIQYPALPGQDSSKESTGEASNGTEIEAVVYPTLPQQQPSKQLPSPENSIDEDSEKMDWQNDLPTSSRSQQSTREQQPSPDVSIDSSTSVKVKMDVSQSRPPQSKPLSRQEQLEIELQQERDAVSKQIREANTSQVVLVNSDDETPSDLYPDTDEEPNANGVSDREGPKGQGPDPTLDIWQLEALESSELRDSAKNLDGVDDLQAGELLKPRRSKLPPTWRRKSQQPLIYSDEIEVPAEVSLNQAQKHRLEDDTSESRKRNRASDVPVLLQSLPPSVPQQIESSIAPNAEMIVTPAKINAEPREGITASLMRRVTERFYGQKYDKPEEGLESMHKNTDDLNLNASKTQNNDIMTIEEYEEESKGGTGPKSSNASPKQDGRSQVDSNSYQEATHSRPEPVEESTLSEAGPTKNMVLVGTTEINTSLLSASYGPSRAGPIPFKRRNRSSLHKSTKPEQIRGSPQPSKKPTVEFADPSLSSSNVETFAVRNKTTKHSSPPFSIHLPFNSTHYKRLDKIYNRTSDKNQSKPVKLPPESSLRQYLGHDIESMGWRKSVEEWELVVVRDFMKVLKREGSRDRPASKPKAADSEPAAAEITAEEVLIRVFSLWSGRVQRGLRDLARDEVEGAWDKRWVANRKTVLARQMERDGG